MNRRTVSVGLTVSSVGSAPSTTTRTPNA